MSSTGRLTKKGQLNVAGSSAASKRITEELLVKDANEHHCLFRPTGFQNHLSHHILAAYDLGAPPDLLKKIYATQAKIQRPIFIEEQHKNIVVTTDNWIQYLENQDAYAAFAKFFSEEIEKRGVTGVLEKYAFDEEVNVKGVDMLSRLLSGVLHPLIGIGYGVEFGIDALVATNLAEACVQSLIPESVLQIDKSLPSHQTHAVSLLELLQRVYESPLLKPVAYDPNTFISVRVREALSNGRKEELERLCALYNIPDNIAPDDLESKIEEILYRTKREETKTRLFLDAHRHFFTISQTDLCGVKDFRTQGGAYVPATMVYLLSRGRPRLDAELAMSYTASPRPPTFGKQSGKEPPAPSSKAIGNPWVNEDYNPWPPLIDGCLYHSESHVLKTMRTLYFAAQNYGDKPAGSVPGAWSYTENASAAEETHAGIGQVDGTVFVRAAGVMMDTLGWLGHGQETGQWDRSALGWNAAWESGD